MYSRNALIGYSGFVGSTLLKQKKFDDLFRSINIHEIKNKSYDTVVCAGAPAVKWLANKEPQQDQKSINSLMSNLKTVKCNRFILISTVDVFKNPNQARESSPIIKHGLHPYGKHRYELEEFVKSQFANSLIVRLPGLVGPGLKKNVIFDFLNNNNLEAIDSRGVFQFYPMVNLWNDIKTALDANCNIIHLTSEPISVKEVAKEGFNLNFNNKLDNTPATYDFQTDYAQLYDSVLPYQYTKKEVLTAIRFYAQSENKKEMNS